MSDKPKRLLIELADIIDRSVRAGLVVTGFIEVTHPASSRFSHEAEVSEEYGGKIARLTLVAKPKVAAAPPEEAPATIVPEPPKPSAQALGYTGDLCVSCGSSDMVRNGTCQKCMNCGSTSGCS